MRLRDYWARTVGPEATQVNTLVTLAVMAVGSAGAGFAARRRGAGAGGTAVISTLAADLAGGEYVNNTRASARWYERSGQGARQHLEFAALHLHPAAVAWVDNGLGRQPHPARWSLAHYAFMLLSTATIRSFYDRRRSLGLTLTVGGLVLDQALGRSATAPWFAWAYYPKLLLGHAAASLWSDRDLVEFRFGSTSTSKG
jgi:hypothetical protein